MTDVAVKRDLHTWKQTNTHEKRPAQNIYKGKHTPNENNTIPKTPVMTILAHTTKNWESSRRILAAFVPCASPALLIRILQCQLDTDFYRVQLIVSSFSSICCTLRLSRVAGKKSQKSCLWLFYMENLSVSWLLRISASIGVCASPALLFAILQSQLDSDFYRVQLEVSWFLRISAFVPCSSPASLVKILKSHVLVILHRKSGREPTFEDLDQHLCLPPHRWWSFSKVSSTIVSYTGWGGCIECLKL